MNEIQEPGMIRVVKMWVIGALLYAMCTIGGFVRGVEGVKIIPGKPATDFAKGEKVDIMVNKLTSLRTQIPLDYYSLPFCVPEGGIKKAPEKLGDLLLGNRIDNSPYKANMNTSELARVTIPRYWGGFPVGYSNKSTTTFLNNHIHIILEYHVKTDSYSDGTDESIYRLVGFRVVPISVQHELKDGKPINTVDDPTKEYEFKTCIRPSKEDESPIPRDTRPLEIKESATVLYTYDIKWNENLKVEWMTRWDAYLRMNRKISEGVHWIYVINSFVIVVFLSAIIGVILIRNLHRDIIRYNRVPTDEERADDREDTGWKLVHADVFRPPAQYPMLLCAAVGTGAQLVCSAFSTIVFAAIGFLSPANRGSMMTAIVLTYLLFGNVAGYFSARLYKTFKGQQFKKCTLTTALLFPGICFSMFLFINSILSFDYNYSTEPLPFFIIIELLLLWLAGNLPLVFSGAYFGFKKTDIEFPVNTSNIPRQIPPTPSFLSPWFTIPFGGLLPFVSVVIEMYCVLSDIWGMDEYYYVFGFLFLIFIILLLTCADIAVMFVYFQLCAEDYNWWWRSFLTTGSTALYLFLFSCWFFTTFSATTTKFMTYVLYFGYMSIILLGVFLLCGSIGFGACLWFNRKIFSTVKVD